MLIPNQYHKQALNLGILTRKHSQSIGNIHTCLNIQCKSTCLNQEDDWNWGKTWGEVFYYEKPRSTLLKSNLTRKGEGRKKKDQEQPKSNQKRRWMKRWGWGKSYQTRINGKRRLRGKRHAVWIEEMISQGRSSGAWENEKDEEGCCSFVTENENEIRVNPYLREEERKND